MAPKKSGAENRRAKREALKASLIEQAKAIGLVFVDPANPAAVPVDGVLDDSAGAFAQLGEPDLGSPATALDYVRKAQLIAFSQICKSTRIDEVTRWKLIKEHSAVLGITHPRSKLESEFKKLKDSQATPAPAAQESTKPRALTRPSTARRDGALGRREPAS